MTMESYNIIGTDKQGDWLITWLNGSKEQAEAYARGIAKNTRLYHKVTAVKRAA